MEPKDFTPLAFSTAPSIGQLLCIPLDTHPFVQYYNTKVCKKAGLLDSSGTLPPIKSADAMLDALRKLKKIGATPVICDTINDPATPWRLFYSLYSQAGGQVLADNGKGLRESCDFWTAFCGHYAKHPAIWANARFRIHRSSAPSIASSASRSAS